MRSLAVASRNCDSSNIFHKKNSPIWPKSTAPICLRSSAVSVTFRSS